MTVAYVVLVLLVAACWVASLCALAFRVQALSAVVYRQAQRIAQLELDVNAALVLARKRLVAGRSGR